MTMTLDDIDPTAGAEKLALIWRDLVLAWEPGRAEPPEVVEMIANTQEDPWPVLLRMGELEKEPEVADALRRYGAYRDERNARIERGEDE